MNNSPWLDGALYPDVDTPDALETLSERVDFLARLCAAWDFGLLPDMSTIAEIRKGSWTSAVDASCFDFPGLSPPSPLARTLTSSPYLGQQIAAIRDDPCLVQGAGRMGKWTSKIDVVIHHPFGLCFGIIISKYRDLRFLRQPSAYPC